MHILKTFLSTGKNGETPLHIAARHGFNETVLLLLSDGADFTLVNKVGENVLHIITKACHYGIATTLLQHILKRQSKDGVTKLVNQKNKAGESSVHYAASLKTTDVHYPFEDRDMMRLLLQSGGDSMLEAPDTRETSVHYCSKSGNVNVFNEILAQLQPTDAQAACNKQAKVCLSNK